MPPGRRTGEEQEGSTWSRREFVGDDQCGGDKAHVTHWSNDGQGNSERTSSDLSPSPSGGWVVENTHTTEQ